MSGASLLNMADTAAALPATAGRVAAATPAAAAVPAAGATANNTADANASVPGAFNALLASLGLLSGAPSAPSDAAADDLIPASDEDADGAASQAALATAPLDLPPALTADPASLMASLPPVQPAFAPGPQPTPTSAASTTAGDTAAVSGTTAPVAAAGGAVSTATTPNAFDSSAVDRHATAQRHAATAGTGTATAVAADVPATAGSTLVTKAATDPTPGSAATASADVARAAAKETDAASVRILREPHATASAAPADAGATTTLAVSRTEATSATEQVSRAAVPAQGDALLQALGERIRVQVAQRSEHAVIRLDPPMMGSVEIVLRHEGGSLQVHLSASHPDVQRQLQNISDALRQDLSQRQYTDVSVNVAAQPGDADGRRRQGGQAERDERPGQALAEAERQGAGAFTLASPTE